MGKPEDFVNLPPLIPDARKIFIVKNKIEIEHEIVISQYSKTKSS